MSDTERPPTLPLITRPLVRIEITGDESHERRSNEGFVRVRRLRLQNRYEDGSASEPYAYDCTERNAMDAVGIVLSTADGRVCLRSSIRPPVALRAQYRLPIPGTEDPTLFEIPAGLVEEDEVGEEGLQACAARETQEEVGLVVEASQFERLGVAVYLSPGLIAEKLHFFHAVVDPSEAEEPGLDGSPVEERAAVEWVSLEDALDACRDGRIEDIKTELALRRLAERRAGG